MTTYNASKTSAVVLGDAIVSAYDSDSAQGLPATNGESVSVDQDGIYTANYILTGQFAKTLDAVKGMKYHPNYKSLIRTNFGLQRMDGDLCRATVVFKGCEPNANNIRYTISSNTQAQPIETHPFFDEGHDIPEGTATIKEGEDAYGYRFGDPITTQAGGGNGSKQALFETVSGNRMFRGFPLDADFDLQGVKQYLDINMTLKLTLVTHVEQGFTHKIETADAMSGGTIFKVGQIVDPPNIIRPDIEKLIQAGGVEKKYNWLVTKCDVQIIGSAMKQVVDFSLSGYLGWNRLIYNMDKEAVALGSDTRYNQGAIRS
jgi:hypothetical protein